MKKDQIFEVIKETIVEILIDVEPDIITRDKSLKDLGANSIDRTEVVSMSMEQFNVKLPLMTFRDVSNIGELVDVFSENIS